MDNPNQKPVQNQQNQQRGQQQQSQQNQKPQQSTINLGAVKAAVNKSVPQSSQPSQHRNPSATPTVSSPTMQIVAAFVVGILVGVIGYTIANKNSASVSTVPASDASQSQTAQSTSQTPASATLAAVADSTESSTSNSVIVHDQPAGQNVNISQIDLKNAGWVVIQSDVNGKPGAILGANYFAAGQTLDGSVTLTQPTVAGTSYFAVLHFDVGTIRSEHIFNPLRDVVMDDSTGHPIITQFTAQ